MKFAARRVISIVGPTASGKSELAIALAQALIVRGQQAEIVNADAYQMYRGMDIGTAKASPEQQTRVKHHLVDIIDPSQTMTVARFQQLARQCIRDLQQRQVRPILVGGSGLYARAAIDDISFPGTNPLVRAGLEHRARSESAIALYRELEEQDPQAAARMDPRNVRRTIRALEVIAISGRPYSASLPRYAYVIPAVQIGLDLPRQQLDERIDRRTNSMLRQGFVDEVAEVRSKLGRTASRALGYREVMSYLDGLTSRSQACADIARKTKRLARKQMGWFGRDPRIHWLAALDPELLDRAMAVVDLADAGAFDRNDEQADSQVQHHLGQIGDQTGVNTSS